MCPKCFLPENAGMTQHTAAPAEIEFEEEFVTGLKKVFEEMIVFNQVLGLKITSLKPTLVKGRIDMKRELIGHFSFNRIHGGVISAGLDAMAGLAVMAAIGARHMDETPLQRLHRFSRIGTIDLRVDYLRPGIGDYFELHARVMRLGSRVATTRMEFLGANGELAVNRDGGLHRLLRRRWHGRCNIDPGDVHGAGKARDYRAVCAADVDPVDCQFARS